MYVKLYEANINVSDKCRYNYMHEVQYQVTECKILPSDIFSIHVYFLFIYLSSSTLRTVVFCT
jgi:hypothetical protein